MPPEATRRDSRQLVGCLSFDETGRGSLRRCRRASRRCPGRPIGRSSADPDTARATRAGSGRARTARTPHRSAGFWPNTTPADRRLAGRPSPETGATSTTGPMAGRLCLTWEFGGRLPSEVVAAVGRSPPIGLGLAGRGAVKDWRIDLTVALIYGQFSLRTGQYSEDVLAALDAALSGDGIGQIQDVLVILSPHQMNFALRLGVEMLAEAPPDDLDQWQEAFEASVLLTNYGMYYESPTLKAERIELPPGQIDCASRVEDSWPAAGPDRPSPATSGGSSYGPPRPGSRRAGFKPGTANASPVSCLVESEVASPRVAGRDRQLGQDDTPLVCDDGILARVVASPEGLIRCSTLTHALPPPASAVDTERG